jgi:hypothetical protein
VPLVGDNRVLVHKGLSQLQHTRWAGLKALLDISGVTHPASTTDIGFKLAPRLNAAGRLGARYQASFDREAHVEPVLRELSQKTGESAAFYIREENSRICVARAEGPQAWRVSAEDIKARNYNLDIKNPHAVEDDHGDPEHLLAALNAAEPSVPPVPTFSVLPSVPASVRVRVELEPAMPRAPIASN